MINYQDALTIAINYMKLESEADGHELVITEQHTIEKPYGWIFFFQSKLFLETQDAKYIALGTYPFIVERGNGNIAYLRGRANIDFPFNGNYEYLLDLEIAYEDQIRETEAAH